MFDVSYLKRLGKKKNAPPPAQGEVTGPAPKRPRTSKASAPASSSSEQVIPDIAAATKGVEAPSSSQPKVAPLQASAVGSPSRQSVLSSSDLAWQKLTSSVGDLEVAELRGTLSGQMAKNMNHDLFKVLAQSFAFYNRLANAERLYESERKKREEALTELEAAKDVAAVAEAEKQEILQHERKTIEENKILTKDRTRLERELNRAESKTSKLEEEIARLKAENEKLKGEAEDAGRAAIENFKSTDDYQEILMPVFLQGFEHAKTKFFASFPDLDISTIKPGDGSDAPDEWDEGEEVAEGAEGDVATEVVSEVIAKVTAEVID